MLLVAGVSVRNLVPRFWDPSDPHCIPGVRALMVSFRDFAGLPGSLRRVEKEGLRKFLGLPDGYQVFIDNGAFHSLTHNVPFDVRGYRTFLGRIGIRYVSFLTLAKSSRVAKEFYGRVHQSANWESSHEVRLRTVIDMPW